MKENYYALMVAIFAKCSPEKAFEKLRGKRYNYIFGARDLRNMQVMRARGETLSDIGKTFGVSYHTIRRRLETYTGGGIGAQETLER